MPNVAPALLLAGVALTLAACQRAPRPLAAGVDACDYCRMTVSDTRFGGEIESRTGKLYTFDAVECLASFYLDASSRDDVRRAWVSDFDSGRLVPVDSAVFLQGSSLNSPMGQGLVAFALTADSTLRRHGGRQVRWSDVLDTMRQRHLTPGVPQRHDTSFDTARSHR
ncbi:MAG TPA: nitrous oxide reductase accessory protein NosL [Gemmatimonadaceae bacterium]